MPTSITLTRLQTEPPATAHLPATTVSGGSTGPRKRAVTPEKARVLAEQRATRAGQRGDKPNAR